MGQQGRRQTAGSARDVGELGGRQTYPLELSLTVPAGTTDDDPEKVTESLDFPTKLVGVDLGWPDGADNLAGVQILTGDGRRLVPYNDRGYLAANDYSNRYPVNRTFKPGDDIVAEYVNVDANNAHQITVVPLFVRIEEGEL